MSSSLVIKLVAWFIMKEIKMLVHNIETPLTVYYEKLINYFTHSLPTQLINILCIIYNDCYSKAI